MENFTFYLNFKNDATGLIEITEPVKFDGASFTVEQDKTRYGRDISYGNEEVSLEFYDGIFDNGLTMGLFNLLDYYKTYGFESEVEFILKKNGVTFTVGLLDFQMAKTDLLTYFECKVIQENNRAIINRRSDINVDVFSDKDLDLNTITPLTTENILLKAKPLFQVSEWGSYVENSFYQPLYGQDAVLMNITGNLNKFAIENSFSPLFHKEYVPSLSGDPVYETLRDESTIIRAAANLTNINIKIKNLNLNAIAQSAFFTKFYFRLYYGTSYVAGNYEYIDIITPFDLNSFNITNQDYTINIPFLVSNSKVWINLQVFNLYSTPAGTPVDAVTIDFNCESVTIEATSTAIDSIIKGIRYIDLFKQNIKSISGLSVDAPKFDVDGEFYEQFAFNGKLIRQFIDRPFYVSFKDLTEGLQEVNADYQINQNNVFIGQYNDFYNNVDLGGYLQAPDTEFNTNFNDRYTINAFNYSYKTYEQNRDETNTIDSIHTDAQFLMPNKLVENNKKIEVNQIRDPFSIESARRQGINTKETTSLDNDDKIFLIDVYPLPNGSMGGFISFLLMRLNDGKLEILNNTLNGAAIPFNWTLLGFVVGSDFDIVDGENIGNYTVFSINETSVFLTPIGFSPSFEGDGFIKTEFPLNNVSYVNRTSQGFTEILNLSSGDNYSNLRYSIKRNMKYWSSYLKTASKYKPSGIIQNTFFKNNGLLSTKYGPETASTVEGGNINVTDLSDAILSPMFYKTKVVAEFETVKTLLDNLATQKGFIRVVDTNNRVLKIHPTKLDYEWVTNLLKIEGEQRNESDFVTIDTIGTELININEVGYDSIILKRNWFKIDGFFVTLYDFNSVPLINPTRIEKVKVNGVAYTNAVNLADAINGL
jgi:hypothetical protein